MSKIIKGVIEDWTILNGRIVGTEVFAGEARPLADIVTSDVIQIFHPTPLTRICETRNSFYVLIGEPQR